MRLPLYQPPEAETLWRVVVSGQGRVPPGRAYWFDNARREPAGTVVVQITLAGRMVLRDALGEHAVEPGQLVVFVLGEPTSYGLTDRLRAARAGYASRWLNMQGAGLRAHADALRRQHGPVLNVGLRGPLLAQMDELAQMAAPAAPVAPRDMAAAVHRFWMQLFELAEQRQQQTMSPAERAVQEIVRRPLQPWSLKELADRYQCSREHLSRLFRQRTGRTPAAYIADARLRRAIQLIEQTELPITAIVAQAGYTNTHTLARHIRHATGHSPTALRHATQRT